ncbi:stage V sporulation protein B [Carboxydothermus islandicus]|uniref:Stage V sporulation protein B n=1 Tax=Carboxydothermus islandicus TaxID=661089 RepID=A0A1L8D4N6_9THEO|nr:stage V sporulation protein B [Carboxydothermus islandicus]GAV26130.1 stage V sporulation protein B [Carboxydothermus islandicus]
MSLLYGTLLMSFVSFFNRILGFVYQVLIVRLLGAEGIGYYNMAYPVFVFLLVISTLGIPLALSQIIAQEGFKNRAYSKNLLFFSIIFLLLFSIAVLELFFSLLPLIRHLLFPSEYSFYAFLWLIPSIPVIAVSSALRGYFIGSLRWNIPALAQNIEQIVRILVSLSLTSAFINVSLKDALRGPSLGVLAGETVGLLVGILFLDKKFALSWMLPAGYLKKIFSLAIPVTLTRVMATLLSALDALLIPKALVLSGLSFREATATYGLFSGVAMTLLLTPAVITNTLSTTLVPGIAEALGQENFSLIRSRSFYAFKLSLIAGLPVTAILLLYAAPLTALLFKYPEAGQLVVILAVSGPFLYWYQTVTGIFQGLSQPQTPFYILLGASGVKILCLLLLTPRIGITGTCLSFALYHFLLFILSLFALKLKLRTLTYDQTLLKVIFAFLGSLGLGYGFSKFFSPTIPFNLVSGILFVGTSYLLLLLVLGGITSYELSRLSRLFKR